MYHLKICELFVGGVGNSARLRPVSGCQKEENGERRVGIEGSDRKFDLRSSQTDGQMKVDARLCRSVRPLYSHVSTHQNACTNKCSHAHSSCCLSVALTFQLECVVKVRCHLSSLTFRNPQTVTVLCFPVALYSFLPALRSCVLCQHKVPDTIQSIVISIC